MTLAVTETIYKQDFEKFLDIVQSIESFWFNVAQLPKTAA